MNRCRTPTKTFANCSRHFSPLPGLAVWLADRPGPDRHYFDCRCLYDGFLRRGLRFNILVFVSPIKNMLIPKIKNSDADDNKIRARGTYYWVCFQILFGSFTLKAVPGW